MAGREKTAQISLLKSKGCFGSRDHLDRKGKESQGVSIAERRRLKGQRKRKSMVERQLAGKNRKTAEKDWTFRRNQSGSIPGQEISMLLAGGQVMLR